MGPWTQKKLIQPVFRPSGIEMWLFIRGNISNRQYSGVLSHHLTRTGNHTVNLLNNLQSIARNKNLKKIL